MTFRHPYITPARNLKQKPVVDSTQAVNLQLFKNPIPFSQTDWPRVQPVKLYVPDVTHTDINFYPNPIPINNAVILVPATRAVSSPPDQIHLNILLPIPFNQLDWGKYQVNPNFPVPVQYPNVAVSTVVVQNPIVPIDWGKTGNIPDFLPSGIQQTNINLFTNPIPFNQTDWPSVKPVKITPPDQQHLNILLPIPFIPVDYNSSRNNPDWLPPSTYPNLNIFTVGSPIVPIDWGKQQNIPDYLPFILYPNLNINTVGSPVIPFDWGKQQNIPDYLPPPQYPNIAISTIVVQNPFFTQDFSKPFVPTPAKQDQQSLNLQLYTNPIPFAQYDWSKPVTVRAQLSDQTYPVLVANFSSPFNQLDWSKGRFAVYQPDQTYPNLLLIQPLPVPFIPVDFQKNNTLPSVPSPYMGSNQNLFTNPIPFNQYDWTKLWGVRPIVSDQNNLPNIAGTNPAQPSTPLGIFGWTDWNTVKSPVIIVPDQDNLPNLVLIINPFVPPVVFTPSGRYLKGYEEKLRHRALPTPSEQIKKAAAVLSSAGGHARAASLTAKQRSNIASTAAQARWSPKGKR